MSNFSNWLSASGDPAGTPACVVTYKQVENKFFLGDNTGSEQALGATNVENTNCLLKVQGTSSTIPSSLQRRVTISLTFKGPLAGQRQVYAFVQDAIGANSGWIQGGNWTVPAPPITVTVSSTATQVRALQSNAGPASPGPARLLENSSNDATPTWNYGLGDINFELSIIRTGGLTSLLHRRGDDLMFWFVLLHVLLCGHAAFAEFPSNPAQGRTPLVLAPGAPAGSYRLNDWESINYFTGKVNVSVPLLTIAGRGSSGYTIRATAHTGVWVAQLDTNPNCTPATPPADQDNCSYTHSSGAIWSRGDGYNRVGYGPGIVLLKRIGTDPFSCNGFLKMGSSESHFIFLEPDGSERLLTGVGSVINTCQSPSHNRGSMFKAMDGSNIVFRSLHFDAQTQSFGAPREIFDVVDASNYVSGASATNAIESNGILYFPDGTRYEIVESRVRAIIDRNGNRTSFIQATAMGGSSTLTSQLARFIRPSLPKVSRVLSPGLGEVSKIQYSYDSATIQAVGSPTVHADYCFTSKAERGNLTRIKKTRTDLSSVTAAGTGTQPAQDLEETLEYDCAGNLRKHTNARGKATEFSYDDDFGSTTIGLSSPFEPNEANYFSPHYSGLRSGAFLTKTTLPSIGGALASAYSISRKYDFYTGQARSEKSANELETTFSHADGLGRPKEMYRGAGQAGTIPAKTIFQYHDIPMVGVADGAATYVQVSQDQNSGGSPTAKEANYFDGLGRLVRTEMHGVEILSKRLFYYDGGLLLGEEVVPKIGDLGQVVSHDYDVLGRIARTNYLGSGSEASKVLYSYGTAVETLATSPPIVTYTASTTKITDERGNIREIHRDAGDRSVRVVELNEFGTVLHTTQYAYDALDNLTEVDQGVQRRFFGYDSLKQLRAAKNPENGLTVYEYDATGNLTRKTDALGVTTTTTYDELDRPTHVDYSGSTPDVSYCYDGKFFIGEQCSGPIPGQRLQMTGVGNSVGYTNYSYDLAGRVVSSVQGIQGGGAYTFAYTYYHNDQLASMKYPTGKLASYTYDANRRLSQVRCQHPSLSSGPCAASNPIVAAYSNYGAHGSPKTISYGNGIVDQMVYNERAQVTSMAVKQGASGPELLKLEYSYTHYCPRLSGNP